jgi:hypothetical protein
MRDGRVIPIEDIAEIESNLFGGMGFPD